MRVTSLIAGALLLSGLGCSSESNPWCERAPLPVENYRWQLQHIEGVPMDPALCDAGAPYFELNSIDKQATGNTGLSQFNGPYAMCGRALKFGPATMTRAANPAPMIQQDADLNYVLSNTAQWRPFGDNQIDLVAADGTALA